VRSRATIAIARYPKTVRRKRERNCSRSRKGQAEAAPSVKAVSRYQPMTAKASTSTRLRAPTARARRTTSCSPAVGSLRRRADDDS
jgi:hypothetical protein